MFFVCRGNMLETEFVAVFIDGNNLYHRLRDCGWPARVEIGSLAERLVGKYRTLVTTYYYNAEPPGGSGHEEQGQYYLRQIRGTPNVVFRKSRLQRVTLADENGSYETYTEKGADTALVADMIRGAAANEFDVAILVSSDGDFAPAVEMLRDYQKRVEVVYFRGNMPFVMEGLALMREFRQSLLKEMDPPPRSRRSGRRGGRVDRRRS